ncbi:hypothetical protein [Leptothoe kymatousa]|uniref:Uncharacterized protein n=1 Tax=Leptothoe kymatousa TAU-MAC 1615 TaxID=2364775 RepID=A0ABS5Y270_9CYAN|nr:hypothetical protein [Leptothoe kymatousa]MBT9311892.1 hypothetical protein [Leptothoe kymatousa TAU-MAC 1615]
MANSVPTWVSPGQARGDLISPLENSAKPIIRYIGIAIIGSVGTGMLTADILRRFYQRKRMLDAAPEPFEVSSSSSPIPEERISSDFDEVLPTSLGVGSSMTLNGQSLLATKLAPGHTVVHFKGYTQQDSVDGLDLDPVALEELILLDADDPSIDVPVLMFLDQVEPAHLDTGDAMVFGVRYQNKYYCLWRSTDKHEQVMGWARRLIRRQRDVIVTQHEQGQYSLWYVPPKHLR